MPELPEIETVVRGLRQLVVGRRIVGYATRQPKVLNLPVDALCEQGCQPISAVERRGKSAVLRLETADLWVHLGLEGKALKDAGDAAAQAELDRILTQHRPDDSVLSEEAADDKSRLTARRVWIIDPLDGTREFSEPPRDDWAVHVALWERTAGDGGELTAGAVAQPALGETFTTGRPPVVPLSTSESPRIAVSRSRPPEFVHGLARELDADLVPMGSAGCKVISVARDVTDAYVHAGGQYEWDSAAPVAVARAAGLFTSRIDGTPLRYNQDDVYLPDLIVCRPELADRILDFVTRNGVSS